jgi:hypothetical protein
MFAELEKPRDRLTVRQIEAVGPRDSTNLRRYADLGVGGDGNKKNRQGD